MRAPRKRRPFRPAALALESICPVSGWAAALPLALSPNLNPTAMPVSPAKPRTQDGLAGPNNILGLANVPSPIAQPSRSARSPVASPSPTQPVSTPNASLAASVDIGRYQNQITVAAVNSSPSRPAMPAAGQDSGGGGGIAPTQATSQPASAPVVSPPSAPASPPATAIPTSPDNSSSSIRPMTMAAASATASVSANGAASGGTGQDPTPNAIGSSGSGSGSGSDSGSAGTNSVLTVSGGSWGGGVSTGTNTYNDPGFVPIGANVSVIASIPNGWNNVQVTWNGGTEYSTYPLGAPDQNAPASMNPTQNVINTGLIYNFIAYATPKTYTITASTPGGSSTITFTTYGPTGQLTQKSQGTANFTANGIDPGDTPNSAFVSYDNQATPGFPQNAGMYLNATVTASPKVGGTLMFFQTITAQRTVSANNVNNAPKTVNWTGNGQVAADNGGTQAKGTTTGKIGYPTLASNSNPTPPNPPTYVTSWPCPVNGPVANQSMRDLPYVTVPVFNQPTLFQVGNPVSEDFSTYLMFQGENGVWVPIAQLNWSWSITATNNNGNWNLTNKTAPASSPPAGEPPAFGPFYTTTYAGSSFQ